MAIAIAGLAAIVIAVLLLRESSISRLPGSSQPVGGAPAEARRDVSPLLSAAGNGQEFRDKVRFGRPANYEAFDFASILGQSLHDAERGSARAQYRASVMLRDCPSLRASRKTNADFSAKGLTDDAIALIRARARRCSAVPDQILEDPRAAGRRLSEAALHQVFPIAVADRQIVASDAPPPPEVLTGKLIDGQEIPSTPLPMDEIDTLLLAALESAGNDRVLRYEAFFLVVGSMDGRSAANGMEADPVVRNAWTLLHCRESWECDLPATVDYLSKEMPESSLQMAIDLALEIDAALISGRLSDIRLH